jgi:hypothetical protein
MKSTEKVFDSPETRTLADLAGIDEDLQSTVAICQKLEEAWRQTPSDPVIIEALSAALLVRYNRCFTSGIRSRLPEELVASLTPKLQRLHQIVRDLRDKYVAHSVNPFEENIVIIEVTEFPDSSRLIDVSVDHRRFLGLKPDMVADVRDLAGTLSRYVCERFGIERGRITGIAQDLPLEVVNGLPEVPGVPTDWKSVNKKRAR